VYDNLEFETAWKRYREVLVSDGGVGIDAQAAPDHEWPGQTYRVFTIVFNQVEGLRKCVLVAS